MQHSGEPDEPLVEEVRAVRAEVRRLNEKRFFRIESSLWRVAVWSLVRGLAFGLGSVLGATILLSVLITVLTSIDFIPVLGDLAQRLIEEIQTTAPPE
ncbi:DUF5665 domain-containing protein [Sinisalibacter lacisalsi]|uniref:Uncharacterized protein n=1 Tax=Sinisalibacter lacisalsi TaxID=1526570 RepID=A0ABQ1Q9F6_9RHOB|nr:DUF5665 domain-containing protein [Sinisalibacter lacisalsi]GGD20059.1 hypothetical protein GCM10011358_00810 [Sinisalibacter lacisalsi]